MSSAEIIDLSELLSPISGDAPAGQDPRQNPLPSSPYSLIKDARGAARAAERNSLFDEGKSGEALENWRKILTLAPGIISDHAKDLEVAAWFTEALIRMHGFKGLSNGFTLMRNMIELFWSDLHPLPDEDGMETRVAPLTGLNGEGAEGVLIAPIRNTVITDTNSAASYTVWQYKQALEAQKISDEELREKKIAQIGFSLADIENAVAKSSNQFFSELRSDLTTAIQEYRKISELLDNHCGVHEAPPTSNIINTLEDVLSMIKHIGQAKFLDEEVAAPMSDENRSNEGAAAVAPSAAVAATGPIRSREDAFRQLHQIADYFKRTEPHSPISYAIYRAIKWGNMPLNELIQELIPDDSSRDVYGSLTGVKAREQ